MLKDQFQVTVHLKEIQIQGTGIGSNWTIELDANGLKKTISRTIPGNSTVSFSGPSALMGTHVIDHYLDGRWPLTLSIKCTEDDPVFDDYGKNTWEGYLVMKPSTTPKSVDATVAARGGDAGKSVVVFAEFSYVTVITRPARLVPTPDWWTIYKWAVEYGLPVSVLRAIMHAGVTLVENGKLDPKAAQYAGDTIYLSSDLYAQLVSGRLNDEFMGAIYNEVFHAWYDNILDKDASWMAGLNEYEGALSYAGNLTHWQTTMNRELDMVEEAMSETWEEIVSHIVSAKRRMDPVDLEPGLREAPRHSDPGKAFHGYKDANKKMSVNHYYVTLYALHYGDSLPAGITTPPATHPSAIAMIIKELESKGLKKP